MIAAWRKGYSGLNTPAPHGLHLALASSSLPRSTFFLRIRRVAEEHELPVGLDIPKNHGRRARPQLDSPDPPRDNGAMPRPRAPRVISALAAVLLAASSVGASLAPRTPSAARCCQQEKRCQHERARTIAPCCCAPGEAPAAGTTVPQVKAPTASAWAAVVAPTVSLAAPALALPPPGAHAPPHCPLFLQRCTLVL